MPDFTGPWGVTLTQECGTDVSVLGMITLDMRSLALAMVYVDLGKNNSRESHGV